MALRYGPKLQNVCKLTFSNTQWDDLPILQGWRDYHPVPDSENHHCFYSLLGCQLEDYKHRISQYFDHNI